MPNIPSELIVDFWSFCGICFLVGTLGSMLGGFAWLLISDIIWNSEWEKSWQENWNRKQTHQREIQNEYHRKNQYYDW